MEHTLFSWHARILVAPGEYTLLGRDIEVLQRRLGRLGLEGKFSVLLEGDCEVRIEGSAPGIPCTIAWDIGAAIEAFAGRHALEPFVYHANCDGRTAEHIMGAQRSSSPGSRGEHLPHLDKVLTDKTLPKWAPSGCAGKWLAEKAAEPGEAS